MPANNMQVKTGEIDSAKSSVTTQAGNFQEAYKCVFEQFAKIDNAWDGDDNAAFNDRVSSFRNDFVEMDAFFEKLIGFLADASERYKAAEADAKQRASTLAK